MPTEAEGGELVAELRKAVEESGLSMTELARISGVDRSQISRFVRGERLLALDAASKLCEALGLRITRPAPAAEKSLAKKKPKPKK
jgi:transcriptional regulator with XRE-family HTH domain